MNKQILKVNGNNTKYFLNKGYNWDGTGQFLQKEDKRIDIVNGQYEFSKVDQFNRRLFVKIITN